MATKVEGYSVKLLDLFSGIGGISLGLESAGMTTVAFCEREPAPRHWLAQHWPGVPIYDDVRTLTGHTLARDVGRIDIIAGGFPCPDISAAGKGAGLGTEENPTERSGLWFELLRLVREVRPRWCLIENVPPLRTRGYDTVRSGLVSAGYACWPFVVGASDIGAPHRRKRVWIVARKRLAAAAREERTTAPQNGYGGLRWPARPGEPQHYWEAPRLAHTSKQRRDGRTGPGRTGRDAEAGHGAGPEGGSESGMADSPSEPPRSAGQPRQEPDPGEFELPMGATASRISGGLDGYTSTHRREALKACGNSVVPPLVSAIGRAIMRMDRE